MDIIYFSIMKIRAIQIEMIYRIEGGCMEKKLFKLLTCICIVIITIQINLICINAGTKKIVIEDIKDISNAQQKVIDGLVYIEAGPVLEALGWNLKWKPTDKVVVCTKGNNLMILKVGSNVVVLNNQEIYLQGEVIIDSDKVLIESQFVARYLGEQVIWNGEDNVVIQSADYKTKISLDGKRNIVILGNGIIANIHQPCQTDTLFSMLDRADSLLENNYPDEALSIYQEMLYEISKDENPDIYLRIMNNIGNAYYMLADRRDREKKLLLAVSSYEEALECYNKQEVEFDYATMLCNLGNAYKGLADISGKKEYLLKSINCYDIALAQSEVPFLDKALLYYNMGIARADNGEGGKAVYNLLRAWCIYQKALKLYTIESRPDIYAEINYNLANIYKIFSTIDRSGTFYEKSITSYNKALKVWTAESYPINYAMVYKCIGDLCKQQYAIDNNVQNLVMAVEAYNESLEFFPLITYPLKYSMIYMEQGNTYILLKKAESDEQWLKKAMFCYKQALKPFSDE